ncbi:MAG: SMP-30/gluconolactonase/LRE family protein [Acidobacteria bacterium]|nr:SMP-30/gluconolactonase/LRE family protein [Acidobacteriota bacterium]
MSESLDAVIRNATPRASVEGGEVILTCVGYDSSDYSACRVFFDELQGRLVSASPTRVIAAVPEYDVGNSASTLRLESRSGVSEIPFMVGVKLADNLHPVANPAVDPEDGSIYVTLSGTRGQKVPVSLYRISPEGAVSPYLSDVVNPTGLAFDRQGRLCVTSRYDGALYRVSPFDEMNEAASDLGIATGLAFDRHGTAYVGDRSGTIYRINEIGETRPFATLEPSVAAYHLAFGPDGDLYVTGPTVSSFDSIMRIDAMGNVHRFFTGLGRPQGLAFDADGNLYVAASRRGHRGIIRVSADGRRAEVVVSGSTLVGLAFDGKGNMIVVSTQRVYSLALGIKGYSVF